MARHTDRDQPFRRKAETVKAEPAQRAVFGERHVLGGPDDGAAAGKPEREAGGRREVGFVACGNLVQRTARKPATKHGIDRRHAKRQVAGRWRAGRTLELSEGLAKGGQHSHKPL